MSARAIESMRPTLHDEQAPKVEVAQPKVLDPSKVPAISTVDSIIADLPDTLGGLPVAATAPSRPVANCITPVVSRTKAYAGGNWMAPRGIVVTVSVYPAGMGKLASGCIQDDTLRRGDIVVTVERTRASADISVVRSAMDAHLSQCIDTSLTPDQSFRNPFASNFTGNVTDITVHYDGPELRATTALSPRQVEVPKTPDFKHWPESLPAMPDAPQPVEAVPMPSLTRQFTARVPDPDGPGCGWAFTGLKAPVTDDAALNKNIADNTSKLQAEMKADAGVYTSKLVAYDASKAEFDKLNPAWEQWATDVEAVRAQWDEQGRRWDTYWRDKSRYDSAVKAREKFFTDREAAQKAYEEGMQRCSVMVTPPPVEVTITPEPVPTEQPTQLPSPEPSVDPTTGETTYPEPSAPATTQPPVPQPTPVVTTSQPPPHPAEPCPARPSILDRQPPYVPQAPTEPSIP